MNSKRKIAVLGIALSLIGLLLTLFYPFESTVVPEWNLRIIDEAGRPVSNIVVIERWRHHSLESSGQEEIRSTDLEGRVSFPHRSVEASLIFRLVAERVARFNAHGESGPKAFVLVLGPYSSLTNNQYSPHEQLPDTIVVRRLE